MGLYSNRVVPRVVDKVCGIRRNEALRERVCAGLHGTVLELGFGSGHNVRHYPPTVTHVAAVEPSDMAWRLAAPRVERSAVAIARSGRDGQALSMDSGSVDCALSTWTLCTIPDAHRALRELHRVLRPGGRLHFVEHGLAPDVAVQRWQRLLEPGQRRLAGGCHLTRSMPDLLVTAGFEIVTADRFYERRTPKSAGATIVGIAVPAPAASPLDGPWEASQR